MSNRLRCVRKLWCCLPHLHKFVLSFEFPYKLRIIFRNMEMRDSIVSTSNELTTCSARSSIISINMETNAFSMWTLHSISKLVDWINSSSRYMTLTISWYQYGYLDAILIASISGLIEWMQDSRYIHVTQLRNIAASILITDVIHFPAWLTNLCK